MITNKEKVFEFIVKYTKQLNALDDEMKFDTNFLSEQVGIQRSNVSTILNQLVKEGKVTKYKGRPVLYSLSKSINAQVEDQCFTSLVGYEGSLKQAVQYTKAAIAYPKKVPKILYVGEKGTGVQRICKEAFAYACTKGILKRNAPYCVVNGSQYDEDQMESLLIGEDSVLKKNNHGFILLKNADHIKPCLMETVLESFLKEENLQLILVFHISNEAKEEMFKEYINFIIHLPLLRERSMEERFQLIELFFKTEAGNLNRRIEADAIVMQCLMSYPCKENCGSLKNDIQFGIANAFLKADKKDNIKLELADFPNVVQRGLLYIAMQQNILEEVVRRDVSSYVFEKKQTYYLRNKEKYSDIYRRLDQKKKMLGYCADYRERNNFVLFNIESDLADYLRQLTEGYDDEKLEKTVCEKLRNQVKVFLNQASVNLNKQYSDQIYYGICLHLNNAIIIKKPRQRLSNENVMEILEKYDREYLISRLFIKEVQNDFHVNFSIDETIFMTLILALDFDQIPRKSEVVTLIVMYGQSTASSIVEDILHFIPVHNIDSFNLSWSDDMDTACEKLKQKIISIEKGKGVLVIYDTGSIPVMLKTIQDQTHIEIRSLDIPLTLLAISSCKYSKAGKSLDEIYQHLICEYSEIADYSQGLYHQYDMKNKKYDKGGFDE